MRLVSKLGNYNLNKISSHEVDEDEAIARQVEKMRATVANSNCSEWDYSYCRRTYRVTFPDGTQRLHAVEALVDYVAVPPSEAEMRMYQQAQAILARSRTSSCPRRPNSRRNSRFRNRGSSNPRSRSSNRSFPSSSSLSSSSRSSNGCRRSYGRCRHSGSSDDMSLL